MKQSIALLLTLVILFACQPGKQVEEKTETADQPADTNNVLTEQQKADGWVLLFDGTTMNGWRTFKNLPNNSWEVADGALHCKPFVEGGVNERADLITEEQYENFEFAFQWMISPQGNSGVMFRVSEAYNEPYATGPEYQVLDDEGYPGEVRDVNFSGGNYDMHTPENRTLRPVGEWNDGKIVVNGDHVEHWLNGIKVVDYDLNSADWTARRDASKWKDFPAYATIKKGHLDLQDHGNEVWFRNLMIKVLP
jgi:hypothetical protein